MLHWIVDVLFTGSGDVSDPWYKRVPPMGWVLSVVVLALFIYGFVFGGGGSSDVDSSTSVEQRHARPEAPQEAPEGLQEGAGSSDGGEPSEGATELKTP